MQFNRMKQNNSLIKNGSILAVAALFIRLTGLAFSAYVSNRIGSEITGLNSLINSVYAFAVTLSLSGINIASTRLTAQAKGLNSDILMRDSAKRCNLYALSFGCFSAFLLFSLSSFLGEKLLGTAAAATPLKILSLSLPFISISSSLNGYFSAVGRVYYSAVDMAVEQFTRILFTAFFLGISGTHNAVRACSAVAGGALIAEASGCLVLYVIYKFDINRHFSHSGSKDNLLTRKLFEITMPVAFSSWIRTALRSAEHILIPKGLTKAGQDGAQALSLYGVVNGMALMIVLFPATVLNSFTGLLVPELSREAAAGNKGRCGRIISKASASALMFSLGATAVLFSAARSLGEAVFPEKGAGEYIMILSLLIPVMYMDTTVDFMLKGLGEQFYVMKINILDSGFGVLFSLFIIPRLGIRGYILSIFFSEIINAALSACKLVNCAQLRLHSLKHLLFPFFSAVSACTASFLLMERLPAGFGNVMTSVIICCCCTFVYILFLFLSDCIPIKYLKNIVKIKKKDLSVNA